MTSKPFPNPKNRSTATSKDCETISLWSQQQLATAAGIHLQSLGKLERGKTTRLNEKTKKGLAVALNIPEEYLDAVVSGRTVEGLQQKRYCPCCFRANANPEPAWTLPRAKYCLLCGTQLLSNCISCFEPIASFKHKFCPHCGTPYSQSGQKRSAG
ncbi:helix-turn-helix domain-containing protein [Oscillatoria nigro-viridis]|uniref:helix-turn-helix domain-containing protein n=1 Tax=Phormidium nigroviride TaxID=482564 RepID=UPI0002EE571F|nr:helix-turn-helix domain-containing protein [Oscillatoria nigro-viridis]